jgi:hypothetical protein
MSAHSSGIPVVNLGGAPDRGGRSSRHRLDERCLITFVEQWWPVRYGYPEGAWKGYRGGYWRRWI